MVLPLKSRPAARARDRRGRARRCRSRDLQSTRAAGRDTARLSSARWIAKYGFSSQGCQADKSHWPAKFWRSAAPLDNSRLQQTCEPDQRGEKVNNTWLVALFGLVSMLAARADGGSRAVGRAVLCGQDHQHPGRRGGGRRVLDLRPTRRGIFAQAAAGKSDRDRPEHAGRGRHQGDGLSREHRAQGWHRARHVARSRRRHADAAAAARSATIFRNSPWSARSSPTIRW